MQAKLQELTDKVYQEGISKAREDSEKIVADAKKQAESIVVEAKKEAEKLKADAAKQAEEQKRNVESEIRLASRQMLASLKQQVAELITTKMVDAPLGSAFDDVDFMKKLLEAVVKNWSSETGANLVLLLSEEWQNKLGDYVKSKALHSLRDGLEVKTAKDVQGFSVAPADGSFRISFSEEGFAGFLREYLRPKAAGFLFEEE